MTRPPARVDSSRFVIAGASGDNSNLGVAALMHATIAGVAWRIPDAQFTVLDNGLGVRTDSLVSRGSTIRYERSGARRSRRIYRSESLWNIRASARLGGLSNSVARRMREASAVLDASGGDSFTDMYGDRRFRTVLAVKRAALASGAPLFLLPQTYGPYTNPASRVAAAGIVRRAHLAFARDAASFDVLRDLLGQDFDEKRHRLGVDLAFALERYEPSPPIVDWFESWRDADPTAPLIGVNVSGLLFNDARYFEAYGLAADYRETMTRLLQDLVVSGARVVIVCHVLTPVEKPESDLRASQAVIASIPDSMRDRVQLAPPIWDPCGTKWLISQFDWFCGARMHATIAALSSGVPVSAVAYSAKTSGVFASCGQAHRVADARRSTTDAIIETIMNDYSQREEMRAELAIRIPTVIEHAEHQLDELVAVRRGAQ